MKLLLIGHSVEDHIHRDGRSSIQPGGIYYTAAALNSVRQAGDEIYLCSSIEDNNYNLFAGVYDKLNNSFLQQVSAIPKVHLSIYNDKERDETYENITQALSLPHTDLNSFDGILINMISGFDITLEQLKDLRSRFNGIIYFDVHTLSRGVGRHMHRYFRKIPHFNQWAENLNIIQANRHEVLSLSDSDDELLTAKDILIKENQALIVTKDDIGAKVYSRVKSEIYSIFKPAIHVHVNNKIGCGDVFGAVFFYIYIQKKNLYESLIGANIAAGITASYSKIEDVEKLKDDLFARYN